MAKAKCKVEFKSGTFGMDAMLWHGDHVLNIVRLGYHATAAMKRAARNRLMRGCVELTRDLNRSLRRKRTGPIRKKARR